VEDKAEEREILLFWGGGDRNFIIFWKVPRLCPLVLLLGNKNVTMVPRCGLNQGGGILIDWLMFGRIWGNDNLVAFKRRELIFMELNWDVRVGNTQ